MDNDDDAVLLYEYKKHRMAAGYGPDWNWLARTILDFYPNWWVTTDFVGDIERFRIWGKKRTPNAN